MRVYRLVYIALLLLCVSCQPKVDTKWRSVGFEISQTGDTTIITVHSPWQQGQLMAQHTLTKPLVRVVCFSATHIGFIHELGMTNKVVGIPRPDRVYSLTEADRQRIKDLGDDTHPNMEAILLTQPDAVILSTYGEGDELPRRLEALGIPIFYCNEWTEATPLARAEWIRFFGACLGCLPKADSIFASVKDAYAKFTVDSLQLTVDSLQLTVDRLQAKGKSIMSGMSWRGTWYVPAGGTFMGHLFCDAGAQYQYAENPSTSSIPLTMEQALQDFAGADVWVGCNAHTLDELQSLDEKHTWFKSFQTGRVYNFYRRTLPTGANDFWESGTVHPERILQDLRCILQDDTCDLYYASPLR